MSNPIRFARALILLLPAVLWDCAQSSYADTKPGSILTVGPGKTYAMPSEAALASRQGDVVRIFPGSYEDCAIWKADGLVIEGAGAGVIITGKVCGDKGLFVVKGNDIIIRNMTFTAARSSAHNGAGIRAEGVNLTVEDSRFIDNEDGILAGDNPAGTIVIKNSTFRGNGNCIVACAHGIYVGRLALLHIEHSEFFEQHVGHHIKSRAARTEILDNSIQDGPDGSASYLVDLPNGGSAMIAGNRFEKGPNSQNKDVAIAIRAEKDPPNPDGEIRIENNMFANDTGAPSIFVKNFADSPVELRANSFTGAVTPYSGPSQAGPSGRNNAP